MNWFYEQPVKIFFGNNAKIIELAGGRKTLLVTSNYFVKSGIAQDLSKKLGNCYIYSNVSPNPDVSEVNECAKILRENNIECIAALGGGSVIDLAKAASIMADDISEYMNGKKVDKAALPVIAIPTTAGTGSEVTCVSVISDRKTGRKLPIVSEKFYPEYAVIDPGFTYSLPKKITASSGIDVLCHAVEGYWSINHQPICDSLAYHAAELVFEYLPRAYKNGNDKEAREKMTEASVIAGLSFTLPKTSAPHACSFPLTSIYGIPHGEACALTLDHFIKINKEDIRTRKFAEKLGFSDTDELAEKVYELKRETGLRTGLKDFHLSDDDIKDLVEKSHHPNTDKILFELYNELKER